MYCGPVNFSVFKKQTVDTKIEGILEIRYAGQISMFLMPNKTHFLF